MKLALEDAGIAPAEIAYINAHGTSTPMNDRCETKAVRLALGDAADRVKLSSTKSMTGHLLGASGAVEAIFYRFCRRVTVLRRRRQDIKFLILHVILTSLQMREIL